jgi:hypothetical protein
VILAATLLTNGLLIGAILVLLLTVFTHQTDKHLTELYHDKALPLPPPSSHRTTSSSHLHVCSTGAHAAR